MEVIFQPIFGFGTNEHSSGRDEFRYWVHSSPEKERKKNSDPSMPKNRIFETAETYVILNIELLAKHTCGALP